MKNLEPGHCYTLEHLILISGLTDRTLRSYLASGILQGEKINGVWHFTADQVDAFLRNSSARPSILAKQNAIIFDFMLDPRKPTPQSCIVLDLPGHDPKSTAEYFCYAINRGDLCDLRFSFDSIISPRVILSGPADQVLNLITGYMKSSEE